MYILGYDIKYYGHSQKATALNSEGEWMYAEIWRRDRIWIYGKNKGRGQCDKSHGSHGSDITVFRKEWVDHIEWKSRVYQINNGKWGQKSVLGLDCAMLLNVKEFGFSFVGSSKFLRLLKQRDRYDRSIYKEKKIQSRYRSRETSVDAFEVAHVVVGCRNQHSGDGLGNRKEEREVKKHHKERTLFLVNCQHSFFPQFHSSHSSKSDPLKGHTRSWHFYLQSSTASHCN